MPPVSSGTPGRTGYAAPGYRTAPNASAAVIGGADRPGAATAWRIIEPIRRRGGYGAGSTAAPADDGLTDAFGGAEPRSSGVGEGPPAPAGGPRRWASGAPQPGREPAPLTGRALRLDAPAHRLRELPHERQAE